MSSNITSRGIKMQVKKRDGRIVDFDENRILKAMKGAFVELNTDGITGGILDALTVRVVKFLPAIKIIDIEVIQDTVEKILMEAGYYEVAKVIFFIANKELSFGK